MHLEAVPQIHGKSIPCLGKSLGLGRVDVSSAMFLLHLSLPALSFKLSDPSWFWDTGFPVIGSGPRAPGMMFVSQAPAGSNSRTASGSGTVPQLAALPPSGEATKGGLRVHTVCLLQGRVPRDQRVPEGSSPGHGRNSWKDLTLSRLDPKAPA